MCSSDLDIDERPEIVELKERFGDLEIDTIIGKNHKGSSDDGVPSKCKNRVNFSLKL